MEGLRHLVAEQEQHQRGEERVDGGEDQAVSERAPHPVMALGAEVLADDGPDRAGEREDDAEGYRHEAPDDGEARHRFIAEGRDLVGDVGIGEGLGQLREDGREGNAPQRRKIPHEPAQPERIDVAVDADHAIEADAEGHDVAEHGGRGRALDAPAEAEDEDRVGTGRDDGRRQRDVHGAPGIAEAAQDEGAADGPGDQHIARRQRPDEELGQPPRLARGAQQREQRA